MVDMTDYMALLRHSQELEIQLTEAKQALEKLLQAARPLNYYLQNGDIRYTMRQNFKWVSEYDLSDLKQILNSKKKVEP